MDEPEGRHESHLLTRSWRDKPWVFLRVLPHNDPRALRGGYPELRDDGFVRVAYEVVHASGFAMWATPAIQQRLNKVLASNSVLAKLFKRAPGERFDHFGRVPPGPDPPAPPTTGRTWSTGLVVLTPDYKLLGPSSFGALFSVTASEARRPQPAAVRLALMVGLIATGLEEPDRTWHKDFDVKDGAIVRVDGEPFERVSSPQHELRDEYGVRQMVFRETVLRLAMLKALPRVLESLPESGRADVIRDACRRLAESVREELFPEGASTAGARADGAQAIYSRELLAWPQSVENLLYARAGESTANATLRLLHALVRARLTPMQMCALMTDLWEIEPFDKVERAQLKTHRSRAYKKIKDARRTRLDPGDL